MIMQIIRHAKECRWMATCPQCGCVFVYMGDEMKTRPADEFYQADRGRLPQMDVPMVSSVDCPECAYEVRIPNMAMYRMKMAYTDDMGGDWDE